MTTLIIAIATTGLTLAGLQIGLVAWLRVDMRRMEDRLRADTRSMEGRLNEDMQSMEKRLNENMQSMEGRLNQDMQSMNEDMQSMEGRLRVDIKNLGKEVDALRKETGKLRERMAHLEGLLEGLREAIVSRAAA